MRFLVIIIKNHSNILRPFSPPTIEMLRKFPTNKIIIEILRKFSKNKIIVEMYFFSITTRGLET